MSYYHDAINLDCTEFEDYDPDTDVAFIGTVITCNHCGASVNDGKEEDVVHYNLCSPIYPENPNLSNEERAKHGLLSNEEMDYWNNLPDEEA
jgi:hypothetical protein